jgi:hypothetical protein
MMRIAPMSSRPFFISLVTSFVLWVLPWAAYAGDSPAAQELFETGKQLVAQGRYDEACPKFAESERLDPGIGTKFHLADCWQRVGRTASAWALFREVESDAHAQRQTARERVARDRASALAPFVSKLLIRPGDTERLPDADVRRDGVEVDRAQWDAPVAVDPGSHIVAVSAAGKQPWQAAIEVPPQGKIVTVDVPPLLDLPAAAMAPHPVAIGLAPAPPPAPPPPPPPAPGPSGVAEAMPPAVPDVPRYESRGGAQRAVGWIFLGAGVVGLAGGGYFTVQWLNDHDEAGVHCSGQICDAAGTQYRSDAHSQETAAIAAGGAGAGAMLIGAILIATAPGPRLVMHTASLSVEPVVNPRGSSGLQVLGTW